jgi:fumarate hydratase class II
VTNTRTETDSIGAIEVPANAYWGAQTQRSIENFPFGPMERMPLGIVHAQAIVKQAAARVNVKHGLDAKIAEVIEAVTQEIVDGKLDDQFPLVIWQTGSGTQTNMNVNEVIAGRANEILTGKRAASRRSIPTTTPIWRSRRTTASRPRSTSPPPAR